MSDLTAFDIHLRSLEDEVTKLHFELDDSYFEAVEAPDIRRGRVHVDLTIRKEPGFFELLFGIKGSVQIPCDFCLDDMEQPISSEHRIIAKYGEEQSDDEDIIIVDPADGIVHTAWLICEYIALSIPLKHVHEDGKCNPQMTDVLRSYQTGADPSQIEGETAADPRWSELEKLKTIFKD